MSRWRKRASAPDRRCRTAACIAMRMTRSPCIWPSNSAPHGKDAASRRGLDQARARLIERGQALIAQSDRQHDALEQARELAAVAMALAPQDPKVRSLQREVETAERVLGFNRAA